MAVVKTNIDEAIARVAEWQGKNIEVAPISGGITNPNFIVTVDGVKNFLKIPGAGTDFIDRPNCHIANVIAAEAGCGPEVYYYFEDTGVEIFQWLEGYRQVTFGDVYKKPLFVGMFEAVRNFHNLPGAEMPLHQSLFAQAWDMIELAKNGDYMPAWHDRLLHILTEIQETVEPKIEEKPCHNDFWTNNMMYNDEIGDLKIIDYEYASMNDPYCDLGLICTTNYFPEAYDVEANKIYHYGTYDELGFAKMKLYKVACDLKWCYWALQQYLNSDVDFDYMAWYGQKIARLQHLWVDPRYDYWLGVVNGKGWFKGE